ncbi:MAG: alpha/beta hydrolase [Cyanobacterium sp. T60_A2020_053]|nr:alpha/beta hydrolase [Cyanobacterium sp. T60_A2020_053]
MFKNPDVLWLNTNPYLRRFNLPIIKYLSNHVSIGHWEYDITPDENSALHTAVELLREYIIVIKKPVHLVGHSTDGLLGLLLSRQYPELVKSLTLLGVGVNPEVDWVNYYYQIRKNLPCSREVALAKVAKCLFNYQNHYYQRAFVNLLDKALLYTISPHSIYEEKEILKGGITNPMMVCGSEDDLVVSRALLAQWQPYLKSEDELFVVAKGGHFFHYTCPQLTGEKIINFMTMKSVKSCNYKLSSEVNHQ